MKNDDDDKNGILHHLSMSFRQSSRSFVLFGEVETYILRKSIFYFSLFSIQSRSLRILSQMLVQEVVVSLCLSGQSVLISGFDGSYFGLFWSLSNKFLPLYDSRQTFLQLQSFLSVFSFQTEFLLFLSVLYFLLLENRSVCLPLSSLFSFNLLSLYSQVLANSTISPITSLLILLINSSQINTVFVNFYYQLTFSSAILWTVSLAWEILRYIFFTFLVISQTSPSQTSAFTLHRPVICYNQSSLFYSYARFYLYLRFFVLESDSEASNQAIFFSQCSFSKLSLDHCLLNISQSYLISSLLSEFSKL